MQRDAGGFAPRPPGFWPVFLNQRPYNKGGPRPPELEWAQGRKNAASPKPRGRSPFLSLIQAAVLPPAFLQRKPANHPEVQGAMPPGTSLPSFFVRRKKVARRPDLKKTGMAGCPRIKNAVLLKRTSNARPPPFVRASARSDKRGKNAAGVPSPQIAGRFSFYENRRKRPHLNLRHTERGCRPKGLGSYKIM